MPGSLTPLITAAEVFPALERLAAGARSELLMSFRIFDPRTALRSPDLRAEGLDDWADLLAAVAARGVSVRLLLSDFDPVFTSDLHRAAWANATGFAEALRGDCDVLCAPHGQRAGPLWSLALRGKIRRTLQELRRDPDALTDLQRRALGGPVRLCPATIHQKLAVADAGEAIIGGLDVNERRWDDPGHSRAAEETWHDVSMAAHGPVAADIRAHFTQTWNAALASRAPSVCQRGARMETGPADTTSADPRLVRTVSRPADGLARLGPKPDITEHEDALIAAIGAARQHIYIETQFFRHAPLARALCRAAERVADLQLTMLVPVAPERVIFDGDDGLDARHGQALQVRALARCKRAFGSRMAVVSPARPRAAETGTDGHYLGAGIVYVHAKVALIDDDWGMVGSANLNGRSMRWDTEASVVFRDAATANGLRKRLAHKWLGEMLPGDPCRATTWADAAERNAARAPQDREGFVLPYPEARTRRFARFLPILPAEMF